MHKILKSILLLLLIMSVVGCDFETTSEDNDQTENESEKFVLTASVISVNDRLMVDVIAGEYASGIYSVIIADEAKITDKSGNKINLSDIKKGDTLEISYNGQTMMSYPPQIVARCIVLQ